LVDEALPFLKKRTLLLLQNLLLAVPVALPPQRTAVIDGKRVIQLNQVTIFEPSWTNEMNCKSKDVVLVSKVVLNTKAVSRTRVCEGRLSSTSNPPPGWIASQALWIYETSKRLIVL
jgi:hypothetical protein